MVMLPYCRADAVVISGRKLARQIRQEARHEVEQWVAAGNKRPHLSVVLVGENPASHSYVLNKTKAAADVGKCRALLAKLQQVSAACCFCWESSAGYWEGIEDSFTQQLFASAAWAQCRVCSVCLPSSAAVQLIGTAHTCFVLLQSSRATSGSAAWICGLGGPM